MTVEEKKARKEQLKKFKKERREKKQNFKKKLQVNNLFIIKTFWNRKHQKQWKLCKRINKELFHMFRYIRFDCLIFVYF